MELDRHGAADLAPAIARTAGYGYTKHGPWRRTQIRECGDDAAAARALLLKLGPIRDDHGVGPAQAERTAR